MTLGLRLHPIAQRELDEAAGHSTGVGESEGECEVGGRVRETAATPRVTCEAQRAVPDRRCVHDVPSTADAGMRI